jgi:hypothetical protein
MGTRFHGDPAASCMEACLVDGDARATDVGSDACVHLQKSSAGPAETLFPLLSRLLNVAAGDQDIGSSYFIARHGHTAYAHRSHGSTHACIDRCSEILHCQWDGALGHCTQVAQLLAGDEAVQFPPTETSLFAWAQTSSTAQIAATWRTSISASLRRSPYRIY